MNTQLFKDFQDFRAQLNSRFLEREVIIDGLLASLITKQNAFLFGAPGTGKSELVREISNGFKGTQYFGYLLSPTTDPSELFGPVAVSKLLKDEYTRDTEGYLPSANIAFLDELFRGSSAVLNSLLTILNERTFNNGKEVVQTPINSIVAATNSFPTEESLQAFLDRFLFRPTVNLLQKPVSKRKLDMWSLKIEPRPEVVSKLTQKNLVELQKQAAEIKPTSKFAGLFGDVMERLEVSGIYISDRRRVQIVQFLRGYAVVKGETELHQHILLETLPHILYQSEDDKELIREQLDAAIVTGSRFVKENQHAANSIMHEFYNWDAKARKISDTNMHMDVARNMSKCLSDLTTIQKRLSEAMDDEELKVTEEVRLKMMKQHTQNENDIKTIAKSLTRFTTN